MKHVKSSYFVFQTLFFTVFLLHFALFDFYKSYQQNPENFTETFQNWLPVLIFDLIAGLIMGIIASSFSVLINNDKKNLIKIIIITDIIWLLFCFWWFFNNRGGINQEAIGHVISPFIVGFFAVILALLNLIISVVANKNKKTG